MLRPGDFKRQLLELEPRRRGRARLEGRPAQEELSRSRRHAPLGARRGVVFLPALPELAGFFAQALRLIEQKHSARREVH